MEKVERRFRSDLQFGETQHFHDLLFGEQWKREQFERRHLVGRNCGKDPVRWSGSCDRDAHATHGVPVTPVQNRGT